MASQGGCYPGCHCTSLEAIVLRLVGFSNEHCEPHWVSHTAGFFVRVVFVPSVANCPVRLCFMRDLPGNSAALLPAVWPQVMRIQVPGLQLLAFHPVGGSALASRADNSHEEDGP